MATPAKTTPPQIFATLSAHITLEPHPDGRIAARVEGQSVSLGTFSAGTFERARPLRTGLALDATEADASDLDRLVRRLARSGLLEYRLARAAGRDALVAIEPQVPDYWPRMLQLLDADEIALSRFAYLRRRGAEMVLESPRAGALFRIGDPAIAAFLAALSAPQPLRKLRRRDGFPGRELLALLLDCRILFKTSAAAGSDNFRTAEGDDALVLWDFHDLLFHTHSTEGRQASPIGGLYRHAGAIAPQPAVRPRWPGQPVDLRPLAAQATTSVPPFVTLLHERHSTRDFDDQQPITLDELARLLDQVARVRASWESPADLGDGSPVVGYAARPYPSGGSAYELELYLAVANCTGLDRGFYHYDAGEHALVPIEVRAGEFDAMLASAEFAMDAAAAPQILITIAARFGRMSWKYSGIAYALILKDVGVLTQTLYLAATEMGLGGCAIGTCNIGLFASMTGLDIHVEGPVGQFALGRGAKPASD